MTHVPVERSDEHATSVGSYELWMLAQGAMGICGVGGMMFLIPAYVVAQGGSPADAGAVMATAGALALSGPFIGNLADRFHIHRAIQLTALGLIAAAGVSFAYAEQTLLWIVAATLVGLGMAGLTVVNATFVVSASFDDRTRARKLSLLQLSLPSGQVLGLALVAALVEAGVDFRGRFLILAGIAVALGVVVGLVNGPPARRIRAAARIGDDPATESATPGFRSVLLSPFGMTLALIVLIMVSAQAIESQYPNYMKAVFDIDPSSSAGALSLIVLVSIPLYLVAGRWTAAAGPRTPFLISAGARAAAGAGLLLLPADADVGALMIFGVVMVVYPLFELNAATLASITSPIGQGAGQGAVGAAMALGTIIASVLAGWIADEIGFSSLATITLVAATTATVLGTALLRLPKPRTEET